MLAENGSITTSGDSASLLAWMKVHGLPNAWKVAQ
jgi:hypothetical protein